MTSTVDHPAVIHLAGRLGAMWAERRQEYLPGLRPSVAPGFGTDGVVVDSSANCSRNEMVFERPGPSCYPWRPFPALAEQGVSASQARTKMPAEDMHRAVSRISRVYAEICETAERIVASAPRELGHGQQANGMSAGG